MTGGRTYHKGFYSVVESCASPPPEGLGWFSHPAAAWEREPLETFQSVPVLWNVANVETERALASVGGPCKIGMGGGGAGPADGRAASGRSAQPPRLLLGILFVSHFLMRTDTKECTPLLEKERCSLSVLILIYF